MENVVVNELNALLKGESMAIDAYERFIQDVEDKKIKREFQEIQQDHKKHAGELFNQIQNLGGKPDSNTGFTGFMASAKAAMENMKETEPIQILKKAYDGEDKGIAMAQEIVKGDLDLESAEIVKKILSVDHDHLKKMLNLITEIQEKH